MRYIFLTLLLPLVLLAQESLLYTQADNGGGGANEAIFINAAFARYGVKIPWSGNYVITKVEVSLYNNAGSNLDYNTVAEIWNHDPATNTPEYIANAVYGRLAVSDSTNLSSVPSAYDPPSWIAYNFSGSNQINISGYDTLWISLFSPYIGEYVRFQRVATNISPYRGMRATSVIYSSATWVLRFSDKFYIRIYGIPAPETTDTESKFKAFPKNKDFGGW